MNPDSIRKCMSLGYSSKTSNTTIGQCNYCIYCFISVMPSVHFLFGDLLYEVGVMLQLDLLKNSS